MDRTIRLNLTPTLEQAQALAETAAQFTAVFNAVCAYGWTHAEKNGVRLHHATYDPLKAQYPALVSDLHVQARVKATEAVRSALTRKRQGRRVSAPQSRACPPRYNHHTFRLDWSARTVCLSTPTGRTTIPFRLPAYAERYVGGSVATADLIRRGGAWWLHVVVGIEPPRLAPIDAVVGIDLGLAQPAVTSESRFLGEKRWRAVEGRYFKHRRALQQRSTRRARWRLRRLRGKQRRFRRDCDHVLSKRVVQSVELGTTLVIENLTNIRRRVKTRRGAQARRVHGWSFAQFAAFLRYKAEERGCTVVGVDPRQTSQTCSRCGYVARNNRRSRAWFCCRACGYQTHADRNGALNIAAKHRAGASMSRPGGLPVNQPIVREEQHAGASAYKPPALAGGC